MATVTVLLLLTSAGLCFGQKIESPYIVLAPEPFSLNRYDAILAASMIDRARVLQLWDGSGHPQNLWVTDVRVIYIGKDPQFPGIHSKRYDLLVNGEPLDWDRSYIQYSLEMINMRVLFTYRNQRPVPDTPYRMP